MENTAQPPKKKTLVSITDKKAETKRLWIFLLLCFGITWTLEISGIMPMSQSGNEDIAKNAVDLMAQIMLMPTFAALAARLATREGLVRSGFQFNFLEYRSLFLFGWFGMTILTFLGAVLYFMTFRENLDPDMTNYIALCSRNAEQSGTAIDAVEIAASYKTDLLMKVFTAAILDLINSFGVEWGFRAYLLPKLFRKIGPIPAVLASSALSGLWYAPLIVMGSYYGTGNPGFPFVNIVCMCLFGMVTGTIYSYLCLRTGSIFPSVFAHSAANVMMPQAALFTFDGGDPFIGPAPTGIVAGLPFIITAAFFLFDMYRHPIKTTESRTE